MKNIVFVYLFLSLNAISQTIAVVSTSNDPVAFASITYYQNGNIILGDYADNKGQFNLNGQDFEILEISCVGFETKRINKADVTENIYLKEVSVTLNEVVINSNITEDIGYSKSKREKIKKGLGIDKFAQMAVFIENPYKTAVVIRSVSFNIVRVTGRPAYRLHLYKKQKRKSIRGEDIPGEDILFKNAMYFLEENKKGLVEIELEEDVEMPAEGVYMALEGLGSYDENGRADNNYFIPEMFRTFEPVYCYNYDTFKRSIGWVNNCQRLTTHEKVKNTTMSKKEFYAPSFGLTVYKP